MKFDFKKYLNIKTLACSILFLMEIYIIVLLFWDIPGESSARIFFIFAAGAVTLFHLIIILELKKCIFCKNLFWILYSVVYAGVLAGFLIASLAYNLKAVNGRADIDQNSMMQNDLIKTIIQGNTNAIGKYQAVITGTNDIKVIFKYRAIIQDLESTNQVLFEKLPKKQADLKIDSFTLIANRFHADRDGLIIFILTWLWGILEIGLFMTAPILPGEIKESKKVEGLKTEKETNAQFLKENADSVKRFIQVMYKKEDENNLVKSTDTIVDETGMNQEIVDRIRDLFCYAVYTGNGKKISVLTPSHGKTTANIGKKELLDLFETFLK